MRHSRTRSGRIAILAVTPGGKRLARHIAGRVDRAELLPGAGPVTGRLAEAWDRYEGFICIMAAGIVVRSIAPLLAGKRLDPCVVVLDELGRFVVSLLSGHLGGGNDLARQVAMVTGGEAVITTATDTLGLTAIDLWARERELAPSSFGQMTRACAFLVAHGTIPVYSEVPGELPRDFRRTDDPEAARIIISCRTGWPDGCLLLHPPQLVIGIGCNRGTDRREMEDALVELFARHGLARQSVIRMATIDLKSDEQGLLELSRRNNWPLDFFCRHQLNRVRNVDRSAAVMKATGAWGVAEPAALLAAQTDHLILRKEKWKNVTLAVARAEYTL